MKRKYIRLIGYTAIGVIVITLFGAYSLACSYVYVAPSLPSVEEMRRVEMQVPLRVYTASGELIAQIGEQRRLPVTYEQIPTLVREAFLAAEDDQFFEHGGVDYLGILRAALVNLVSHEKAQGASTITQQAARNMFLTLDKTWKRKLSELFVTWRMEREFSKQEILGLYLNVIYFGQRAYGVAAAAETFFGKTLDDLTVSEAATLAGVPQAPSRYNPISNPEFAAARRGYVLGRMHKLGFIDDSTYEDARKTPVVARTHAPLSAVEAPYVAEMARLDLRSRFGPAAEAAGYRVFTTIDGRLQTAANRALRLGLIEYDRRHGWRGPIGHAEIAGRTKDEQFDELLEEYSSIGLLVPAVVVSETEKSARVFVRSRGFAQIGWDGLSWARKEDGPAPKSVAEIMAPGDVVYVVADGKGNAQLGQLPEAQSALVSLNPTDGSIVALVGGFDYFVNKYNRVTQARRQPGSGFKPFLYSAALDNGFTPASVILDAPVVKDEGETVWRPKNDGGHFNGPTRFREALYRSRNLVSIRVLRQMGVDPAIDYITRFGFSKRDLPRGESLALGTVNATPLQLAAGYAIFANGGFKVVPHYIDRIENAAGEVVYRATPKIACDACENEVTLASYTGFGATKEERLAEADALRGGRGSLPPEQLAERVISPQNDWLMTDMMRDVIRRGTGVRARALGRSDIAGKTGTTNIGGTNESKDVWFNGYTANLVATVWVGFDQEKSLGVSEQGSNTALPIWMHFMREALRGVPEYIRPMPEGLVTLRISPDTGMLASGENPDAILETFMTDRLPNGSMPGENGPQLGPGVDARAAEPGIF